MFFFRIHDICQHFDMNLSQILSDPGVPGVRYMGPVLSNKLTLRPLCRLTLANEDTNSIQADNANKAFQSNMAMQVTQPGDQLWNQMQGRL